MVKYLLDILVSTFIFLNIFAFEFPIMGVPARFILLGVMVILTFIVEPKYYFSTQFLRFIGLAYLFYALLTCYSLILGNDFVNILLYIRPLLMLMSIPTFQYVFDRFGIERYLQSLSISCIALIFFFIILFVKSIIDPSFALQFGEEQKLVKIVVNDLGIRVGIKTFSFIIPFAIYIMSKIHGLYFYIFTIFIIIIAGLSQSIGIVIPIVIYYFFLLFSRNQRSALLISVSIIALIVFVEMESIQAILTEKGNSAGVKTMQVKNLFKDMDFVNLMLGRGIGCEFNNFDSRGIKEVMIEVAAVQIFQSGGLIFSWLILFVYLRPALIAIKNNKPYLYKLLGYSHLAYFLAAMSNPYLWGGGALLLVIFIIAYPASSSLLNNHNSSFRTLITR